MRARTKADVAAHLRLRRQTLAAAAEWMFAVLQVHVDGCPACRYEACTDAAHASVRLLREALRQRDVER